MIMHLQSISRDYPVFRCTRNSPPGYILEVGYKSKAVIDGIEVILYTAYKRNHAVFFQYKENWFYCLDTKLKEARELKFIGFSPYESKSDIKRITQRREQARNEYFIHSDGGRSDSKYGKEESNDCTVRAIAHILNLPYDVAHIMMKSIGRKDRDGFKFLTYMDHGKFFSHKFVPVVVRPNSQKITVKTFCQMYPTGRYLVFTKGHVQAIIEGKSADTQFWERAIVLKACKYLGRIDDKAAK